MVMICVVIVTMDQWLYEIIGEIGSMRIAIIRTFFIIYVLFETKKPYQTL